MRLLLQTNDLVLLTRVCALLAEHNIQCIELDTHMSVLEGSIGILPRRLMVAETDWLAAHKILKHNSIQIQ